MFKKNNIKKNIPVSFQTRQVGLRVPILPASTLLASREHQLLLSQLRELSLLDDLHFDALYQDFIYAWAEFVQMLPAEPDGVYGSLLNDGLIRGYGALIQLITNHVDATPLERYAMTTAGIVFHVAHVVVNQRVFLTDDEGVFIQHWDPFSGPMMQTDEIRSYKLMPLSSFYQRRADMITPLLAKSLLPHEGFLWLTSDLKIFMDWLDIFSNDARDSGGQLKQNLNLFMQHFNKELLINLPNLPLTLEESPATVHADAFLEWLKKGILSGDIKINSADSGVHVTTEGVFLEKNLIFKKFVENYPVPINMFTIYQQFGNLFGLTKLSGSDYRFLQLFSTYPDHSQASVFSGSIGARARQIREGVLIKDPNLIFMNGKIPEPTAHLKFLSQNEKNTEVPNLDRSNLKGLNRSK